MRTTALLDIQSRSSPSTSRAAKSAIIRPKWSPASPNKTATATPRRPIRQRSSRRAGQHPARVRTLRRRAAASGSSTFIARVEKPVVLTLHTVLPEPERSVHARYARALRTGNKGRRRFPRPGARLLESVYGIDPQTLRVIHHGVPDVPFQDTDARESVVRHRPAHGDLDVRPDQSRQRSRICDRSDARRSSSAIPKRSI